MSHVISKKHGRVQFELHVNPTDNYLTSLGADHYTKFKCYVILEIKMHGQTDRTSALFIHFVQNVQRMHTKSCQSISS